LSDDPFYKAIFKGIKRNPFFA